MSFKKITGTYDIFPEDSKFREKVKAIVSTIYQVYGYELIETPVIEFSEVFKRGVGTDTDIVQKEMFEFEDRGSRQICLRPEGTAGVVRAIVESGILKTKSFIKTYYYGPMFRAERPQKGRFRQFYQFGSEAFGSSNPMLDAEVVDLYTMIMSKLNISSFIAYVNSTGCNNCRPGYLKILVNFLSKNKEILCENCKIRIDRNPLRVLDCKKENCKNIFKDAPSICDHLCDECKIDYKDFKEYMDASGVEYKENKFLVRGLDYYTKNTFEIVKKSIGAQDAIVGGGRYDNLVRDFGWNSDIPAIGAALGIERLIDAIDDKNNVLDFKLLNKKIFFAFTGQDLIKEFLPVIKELRIKGAIVNLDFSSKSMKGQFKMSNQLNSDFTVIVGEDEIRKNELSIRDMRNGTQKTIRIEKFNNILTE